MSMALVLWFVVINGIGYLIMSEDKRRAQNKRRDRIPEKTLFLIAAIGGALGVLIGMYRKRHKTRHASFRLGIPLILFLNAVLYGYLIV